MHSPTIGRRGAAALAAAVLATVLAACGGSASDPATGTGAPGSASSAAGTKKITVGVIPIIDVAPLYLGIQKGFFSSRGLEITPAPAQGGSAIVPAVLAGENQFGFSNVVSLLTAREKGVPLVAVVGGASSTGDPAKDVNAVLVAKGSPLKTAKDLEGKKVAINALNNIGDTTIKTAVKKAGGDPSKVTFVEMPFPDMPAQLAAGKVDAAWESEPFRSQILAAGGSILFDNLTETYPKLQIATYFTSEKLKAEDPATVTAFVEGMEESLAYAVANPDEARAVLATYTKIPPEVAAKVVLPAWPAELDAQSATAVGEAARSFGTLTKAPDVAGLFAGA
ncbi:ABC transporter substrate-binding protein [Kineosporia sp. R_H_3]|uniref:ABC transporter substrate-binding protein n=1 Tax=Kineosporia sp. R_H_3 TaxID=1961848 RepID=UPI000B4C0B03|nr:ABC transporter substrate-binding protein [Kineosporia sp. R_H_3]